MNPKFRKPGIILVVLLGVAAIFLSCQNLDTANINEPDTEGLLQTPEDIEALIGSSFVLWFQIHSGAATEHMAVMADALSWSWGNFGGQAMSSEPRIAYPNNTSHTYYLDLFQRAWSRSFTALSAASDGLRQLTGDSPVVIENATRTHRAIAFGKLVQGLSTGYLACYFDKAFILDETTDLEQVAGGGIDISLYSPYTEVIAAAQAQLEEAISLLESGPAFSTEENWVNGVVLTNEDLAKVAHSYLARYLAQAARNPGERAAVDWAKVRFHAERGVTEDLAPMSDGANNWWHSNQWYHNDRGASWGRLDYKLIGGSDESGGYQNWLNTPVAQRTEFDMVTSDKRLSGMTLQNYQGVDGDGGIYAGNWGSSVFRADRGIYHFSKYGYYRYQEYGASGGQGPMPLFIPAENDFLAAEAMLRTGDAGGAAALIDKYHVTNGGYPSSVGAPVGDPGDARSPLAGSSLWAMLKYNKHLEILQTGSGVEYFDNRGWGDLVSNTPEQAPIPAQELEVLETSIYTFGGGGTSSAPKLVVRPPRDSAVH